jgi:hypothetical protein
MLPAGYRRQWVVLLCALSLVWLLAFVVAPPSVAFASRYGVRPISAAKGSCITDVIYCI